jgi:hypothetical protein
VSAPGLLGGLEPGALARLRAVSEELRQILVALRGVSAGLGAPSDANGTNGDIYFRKDGAAGTTVYHKRSGDWVGIL